MRFLFFAIVLIIISYVSAGENDRYLVLPNPEKCKSRFKEFQYDGRNYFYSGHDKELKDAKLDWLDSRNSCRERCMETVSLETQKEFEFIKEYIEKNEIKFIWTSGRLCDFAGCEGRWDLLPKIVKGWLWSANQHQIDDTNKIPNGWTYIPWSNTGHFKRKQPDNAEFFLNQATESCLGVLNNQYNDSVAWHDIACYHKTGFICEDSAELLNEVQEIKSSSDHHEEVVQSAPQRAETTQRPTTVAKSTTEPRKTSVQTKKPVTEPRKTNTEPQKTTPEPKKNKTELRTTTTEFTEGITENRRTTTEQIEISTESIRPIESRRPIQSRRPFESRRTSTTEEEVSTTVAPLRFARTRKSRVTTTQATTVSPQTTSTKTIPEETSKSLEVTKDFEDSEISVKSVDEAPAIELEVAERAAPIEEEIQITSTSSTEQPTTESETNEKFTPKRKKIYKLKTRTTTTQEPIDISTSSESLRIQEEPVENLSRKSSDDLESYQKIDASTSTTEEPLEPTRAIPIRRKHVKLYRKVINLKTADDTNDGPSQRIDESNKDSTTESPVIAIRRKFFNPKFRQRLSEKYKIQIHE